jgi:hypothetical protein
MHLEREWRRGIAAHDLEVVAHLASPLVSRVFIGAQPTAEVSRCKAAAHKRKVSPRWVFSHAGPEIAGFARFLATSRHPAQITTRVRTFRVPSQKAPASRAARKLHPLIRRP